MASCERASRSHLSASGHGIFENRAGSGYAPFEDGEIMSLPDRNDKLSYR